MERIKGLFVVVAGALLRARHSCHEQLAARGEFAAAPVPPARAKALAGAASAFPPLACHTKPPEQLFMGKGGQGRFSHLCFTNLAQWAPENPNFTRLLRQQ